MESNSASMVVETDLKLIKDAFAAEDIKSDSRAFRKSNRSRNLKFTNAERAVVNVSRNRMERVKGNGNGEEGREI